MKLASVDTDALVEELMSRYECVLVVISREGMEALDDDFETISVTVSADRYLAGLGLAEFSRHFFTQMLTPVDEEDE